MLRAHIPPSKVSVIPNAVDSDLFLPAPRRRRGLAGRQHDETRMTIVVVSRCVARTVLPRICFAPPNTARRPAAGTPA